MTSIHLRRPAVAVAASALLFAGTIIGSAAGLQAPQPPQGRGQQGPPAPTGPMAPEKYKNIQALKDVQADQLDLTMRYIVAATGIQCIQCHVRDPASGEWQYDKDDKNTKKTARKMMVMVNAVNAGAGDYGLNGINCGTCHAGNNQPRGLQPAQMQTADQIAAYMAQQAAIAARQGGGPGGQPGAPPAGAGGAPAGAGGGQGGRGQQTPAPPVEDILAKYVDALGGRAAVEKLQSVVMTGTMTNKWAQSFPFTIEEKGVKFRQSIESTPSAVLRGFDGTSGWEIAAGKPETLDAFPTAQLRREDILMLGLTLKDKYPAATSAMGRVGGAPGTTAITANTITNGRGNADNSYTTETFLFDATTGLLLRKTVRTTTGLRGTLTEQWDYADYRAVAGVKMPFEIKHTNWAVFDTFKVTDIKANPSIDDARFAKPKG